MAFNELYRRQVALLLRVLPVVAGEKCFALKGGTAINLFHRDLPRLSVDIDLAYLPVRSREESLADIDAALRRIGDRLQRTIPGARIQYGMLRPENTVTKIMVRADGVQIKIEVTPVMRGTVFEPELRTVSPAVEEQFGFSENLIVSFADLYGGKIVAALDRQHPRDLFDVRDLLAHDGISEELRTAFIVYLISHGRPMHEVLRAPTKPIEAEFLRGFEGMTVEPVTVEELVSAREELVSRVIHEMPPDHREFLIAFERGEPDWSLFGLTAAAKLPAVRWRQQNLATLSEKRRAELVARLRDVLEERDE